MMYWLREYWPEIFVYVMGAIVVVLALVFGNDR